MSVPRWGANDRWPNKPIEFLPLAEPSAVFAFGHVPFETFRDAFADECLDDERRPWLNLRHEWWHLKYDLSEEYGFIYTRKDGPGPFIAPVTVWGES